MKEQARPNELSTVFKLMFPLFERQLRPYLYGEGAATAEIKTIFGPKFDFTPYDIKVLQSKPQEADIFVICGTVTYKILPYMLEAYKQMARPCWVLWLGGVELGQSEIQSYSVVKDLTKYLDIDVYVPGNPPTPEQIMDGFLQIRDIIKYGK